MPTSIKFKKYLSAAKDVFEDQALFLQTIKEDTITHIRKCTINTVNISCIDGIIHTKTFLMVTVSKDTCLQIGDNIHLLALVIKCVSKSDNKNTLILCINWSPVFINNRLPAKDVHNFVIFSEIPFPPPVNTANQAGTTNNPAATPPAVDPNFVRLFEVNNDILCQQATMIQQLTPKAKTYSLNITPFVPLNFPTTILSLELSCLSHQLSNSTPASGFHHIS